MQVQFKNALFDTKDFDFAVVDGNSLVIALKTREIVLEFETQEEALVAQAELGKAIDAAKKDTVSVSDLIEEAANAVSGVLGGLFGSVKAKATKATSSFEARAEQMASDLEEVIKTVRTTASETAKEANDVFGTTRSTASTSVMDTVVADLSDAQLRAAIDTKVAQLLVGDARVQALHSQLQEFYTDAQIEQIVNSRKNMVFDYARDNDEMTLAEVFSDLLRSL